MWHIYEDVGGSGLDRGPPDPGRVAPVVELIADLHSRFADHPLLAECRGRGGELGIGFFTAQVDRSIGFLKSIGSLASPLLREQAVLRDRLLGRVERLHGQRDERALLLETYGGPDTLLHGDLWTTNTLVLRRADGPRASLIDWDHVGVGPVTYDLSTFLYRFAPEHRPWILGRYRAAAARPGLAAAGRSHPEPALRDRGVRPLRLLPRGGGDRRLPGEQWAFEQLAEIDSWFASLEPALAIYGGDERRER